MSDTGDGFQNIERFSLGMPHNAILQLLGHSTPSLYQLGIPSHTARGGHRDSRRAALSEALSPADESVGVVAWKWATCRCWMR